MSRIYINGPEQVSGTVAASVPPGTSLVGAANCVLYANGSGVLAQDPIKLNYDGTLPRLSVGGVNSGGFAYNPSDLQVDAAGSIRARTNAYLYTIDGTGVVTFPPPASTLTIQNYGGGVLFAPTISGGITFNTTNSTAPGWSMTDVITSTGVHEKHAAVYVAQTIAPYNNANHNSAGWMFVPSVSVAPSPGISGATFSGLRVSPTFYNKNVAVTNVGVNISQIKDAGTGADTNIGLFVDMRGITNSASTRYAGVFLGGFVGISNASPQALLDVTGDGALVLLPRKSTTGNPTGINGGIYYNTADGKFRAYQSGAWSDMIGGGGPGGGLAIGSQVTAGTSKSILFVNAGGNLAQDNSLFAYDNSVHRLGVGTNNPTAAITSLVGATGNMEALLVTQNDTGNNPTATHIVNAGSGVGLHVQQNGSGAVLDVGAGAVFVDNTGSTGIGVSIYSNQAAPQALASLLMVNAANASWNQPVVYIRHTSTNFAATSLRIDGGTPAIAMVDTSQAAPAGKYQISCHNDTVHLEGRNAADNAFDTYMVCQRLDASGVGQGGTIGIRTGTTPGHSTLQVNGSFAVGVNTSVTGSYIATKTDSYIAANATANGLTVALPFASGIGGRIYNIVKTDTTLNPVGVAAAAGDNISGVPGLTMNAPGSVQMLISDGTTNWWPLGTLSYTPPFVGNNIDGGYTGHMASPNSAVLIAVEVHRPAILTGTRMKVTVTSGNVDVGVYDVNGTRLASNGGTACPSTGKQTINYGSPASLLVPGIYFLAIAADNISATFSLSGADAILGTWLFTSAYPLPATLSFPGTPTNQPYALMGVVNGGLTQ